MSSNTLANRGIDYCTSWQGSVCATEHADIIIISVSKSETKNFQDAYLLTGHTSIINTENVLLLNVYSEFFPRKIYIAFDFSRILNYKSKYMNETSIESSIFSRGVGYVINLLRKFNRGCDSVFLLTHIMRAKINLTKFNVIFTLRPSIFLSLHKRSQLWLRIDLSD